MSRGALPSSRHLGGAQLAVQQPGFDFALALDLDHAAGFELVTVLEAFVDGARDLNLSGHAGRLHAACEVYGVSPEVVDEFGGSDNAGDNGTGVDADAKLEVEAFFRGVSTSRFRHAECHAGHAVGVIGAWTRESADGHVAVADGFDFLDAQLLSGFVIQAEKAIE